ncbi:phosphotransferase [Paracrocinitomix mangrovi]|uniref:phosphotransferase n=1 Tax=Paracrocinitomix mangrovi TaxID=2862509 RepID=UPI001C8E08BF|nr:phosphotransferase [Paracrocinitomix mangrovi]UKN00240.1 phosphotransferase [Paracrocinitomix mangrovi]
MSAEKYTIVPGRGLLTKTAIAERKKFLKQLGINTDAIEFSTINPAELQQNIESLIGSTEIPTGLVGPLLFNKAGEEEQVYCAVSTLEGALVASMNRGAKAISLSGGFKANFVHQKMVRTPLFILSSDSTAQHFENWLNNNFEEIKKTAESYSNHANLRHIQVLRFERNVHVHFVYTTGDAAGQNMTTTCTWHAILWLVEKYKSEGFEEIKDFVLEGNGASDKKVSQFLIDHGRGCKVEVSAILKEDIIQKILRTTSDDLLRYYGPSIELAKKNGMLGYNINVANAIAGIFAATGQDLASIPESSMAFLDLKKHAEGLEVSLTLFSLVVGTVGGGTHLQKQREALTLMGCQGEGKLQRFASLIAGFALGLELSTYAAIVSGEFAKAHEKLGRNKPVNWLQWNEIDTDFISKMVKDKISDPITEVIIQKGEVDNGILMNLCKKVNRKLIGFIPVQLKTPDHSLEILLKSKATDIETIKGIHLMAASIDPELCDLIVKYKNNLEYINSHLKELLIPQFVASHQLDIIPQYYGHYIDDKREIYILAQERLHSKNLQLFDSENSPQLWTDQHIKNCIKAITEVHLAYLNEPDKSLDCIQEFKLELSLPLYQKLLEIAIKEEKDQGNKYELLESYLKSAESIETKIPKTLIHNDFNPRNIAIRNNADVCIYDWELSVIDYPHRDIVELLSFTLNSDFEKAELLEYLQYHYELAGSKMEAEWNDWKNIYPTVIKEYLASRVLFYNAAQVNMKLKFVDRIYNNCLKMIEFLED